MINNKRSGFTLIEILIVVAIIAILASVVLIGLGPTQQAGRDARRISDLREVENGLELYFNKCGYYPGQVAAAGCPAAWASATYADLVAPAATNPLTGSNLGISNIPQDPSANKTYFYEAFNGGSTYTLGAVLENQNNAVFNNYTPPANIPTGHTCAQAQGEYCISL